MPAIACRYAGKDNLAAKMAAAIVAHQDHAAPKAAGVAAALMLERVILGQSIPVRLLPLEWWTRHAKAGSTNN